MKNFVLFTSSLIFASVVLMGAGCSPSDPAQPAATSSNTAAPPVSAPKVPALPPLPAGKHAAIIAEPNPIKVCDDSGVGVTAIAFTIEPPVTAVDVRVGSPTGGQLASLGNSGHAITGRWVNDGLVFYLQDITGKKPLTPENTLATVTVKLTREGCP